MIIAVLHGQESLDELCKYMSMCWKRTLRLDIHNVIDVAYITIGWWAILRQASNLNTLEKPLMAYFSGLSWLRLLYSLRGTRLIGPRLLPILYAVGIGNTLAFTMVTATCLVAATHTCYNLQLGRALDPTYGAFIQVVRLGVFGDFDLTEFETSDEQGPDYVARTRGAGPMDLRVVNKDAFLVSCTSLELSFSGVGPPPLLRHGIRDHHPADEPPGGGHR